MQKRFQTYRLSEDYTGELLCSGRWCMDSGMPGGRKNQILKNVIKVGVGLKKSGSLNA